MRRCANTLPFILSKLDLSTPATGWFQVCAPCAIILRFRIKSVQLFWDTLFS